MIVRLLALLFCLYFSAPVLLANATSTGNELFRLGFSTSLFTDVDENDAKAAMKVWGQVVGKARNIPIDADASIYHSADDVLAALQSRQIDAVGITTVEYFQIYKKTELARFFVTRNSGSLTEKFILLAHRDGAVKSLADLNGRNLHVYENARTSLATVWLNNTLYQKGQGRLEKLAGSLQKHKKLANTVLPVFFRQVDACLVTRSGFDVMTELNPQLGQALMVVAESEDVVPAIFVFRKDYQPTFLEELVAGLNELDQSSAGQQILNLFNSDGIEERPREELDLALDMLEKHENLPL
ncbi:phosphonate transport system substrate-binding protein [Malonomonas rubra DSM 5091]|uniref:Phosphonate transport system substrate-binding protein n=1 Tax=Malonomonas rubra DSM 5091 TaxID=1122189 RepID=A0A1M6NEC0_MALRU|nr:PhnD/SsuA/transferrin family substrate-binding protein [Malonomonas rubra]SHJ94065.1 phosphonate transport system substrate-binding protein [Malonomonas rubra DSM 5091]